jgi:hypothetical protein
MLPFTLGVFTIRFGSVFIKKSNQTEIFFFKKKNRNRFKPTGFSSVRFSFLEQKPVWLGFFGLARFFPVWLGFGSVFSVLARFGSVFCPVFFGSVRLGFSGSRLKKPKPNRTGRFFQNFNRLIRFFFTVRFFRLFFFRFSRFNRFFGFFEHP